MATEPTSDDLTWGSASAPVLGSAVFGDDADSWEALLAQSRAAFSGDAPVEDAQLGGVPARPAPHLEVLGPLGVGGMGEVLRVADHQLRRLMAMKVLHHHLAAQPEVRARFIEEAQATAQLAHPGIIPVHELGTLPDGRPYFTMKQVEGRTLAAVLAEDDPAPRRVRLRRLIGLLGRVCDIVGYAHSRAVVHRDLKPHNVMTGAFGEVLVLDWGLIKIHAGHDHAIQTDRRAAGGETRLGRVSGTPRYMSPEQARGESLDARSDVYALGAILFEVLAGAPLQPQGTLDSLLAAVAQATGRRPMPADAPIDLAQITARAISAEPADRFANAAQMGAAIRDWLDGARARERALGVVLQALSLQDAEQAARQRSVELDAAAKAALDGIPPSADAARKRRGWLLADQALEARQEAERLELERLQQLHAALSHSPELPEALEAIAEHHRRKHAQAEQEGDILATARHEQQLRFYDRGQHRRYLSGEGALTLHTVPPGATVTLHPVEQADRRMVEGEGTVIGQTPIAAHSLPMGDYLLQISHPACHTVRYPVRITRQHHWDGVPPGGSAPLPIVLPERGQLGEGDVYVPAGWTVLGGTERMGSPRRRVWVDGFVIRQAPVTNREYIAFLDDLVLRGEEAEALRWVPRARPGRTGELGAMVYGRREDGTFKLVPDADGDLWLPDWPVVCVRGDAGQAFASWRAAQDGVPWQLPQEAWWEKAGRGVDGRMWPWGHKFDPSFANVRDRYPKRPRLEVVGALPTDRSPYGVWDQAGNVREWCADPFRVPGASSQSHQQTVRGGCFFFWCDTLYDRLGLAPQITGDTIGFRLAAQPDWLSPSA